MDDVLLDAVESADTAYATYQAVPTVANLLVWYKAELVLGPPHAEKHRAYSDEQLGRHTRHVEIFATAWRKLRLAL